MFVVLDTRYGMARGILMGFPEQCYAIHSVHSSMERAKKVAHGLRDDSPDEFLGPYIIVEWNF